MRKGSDPPQVEPFNDVAVCFNPLIETAPRSGS